MSEKTITRWAIRYPGGLYVGQTLTRLDAIAEHVWSYNKELHDRGIRWARGGLDPIQKAEWERCRKRGDRAVKVKITYEPTP
jgi:hypothetical protein